MKLLVSAYACAPHHGSEHAIGWNWTTEAKRLGHEVWVLASPVHRDAIEAACREDPELASIHWVFPEVHSWPLRPGVEPRWERTYNLLWQRAALCHARTLQSRVKFDAVHHLTWCGVRAPTFLGSLGPPLIMGPLGGGETCPLSLRDGFDLKGRITERIRDLSNATITFNPLVRGGLSTSAVIVVRTPDTLRILSRAMQRKTITFFDLALRLPEVSASRTSRQGPLRLLYAGRLLYWKGVHIAIRAFKEVLRSIPDAQFTIVGSGPEEGRLRALVGSYQLSENVQFISWLPQRQLFDLYRSHDLFVFPSLHDSGGLAVIEALSHGLPVMCLNLGGPQYAVTPGSGIVINTNGLNTEQVAMVMAGEISELAVTPARLSTLSDGAFARANQFVLRDRVASFYNAVSESVRRLDQESGRRITPTPSPQWDLKHHRKC